MSKPGNEPAYPCKTFFKSVLINGVLHENYTSEEHGMTIRQRFALVAMQANRIAYPAKPPKNIAELAIDDADACLAREEETREG